VRHRGEEGWSDVALYHWTGRIKQAQTINGGTVTTVDYEYDTEGNRFIKRTDLGGIVTEIHDLSSDYRIYADGSSEVHTIEIRNGNDPVARFRFQDNHHNSGVWAPSSLFSHRLGADFLRIAALEGGITKLPTLMAYAAHDAYHAVKLLPQIQNKARLLVFLYWILASSVALAALVLLVRAWRRNPDDGPGLLPVGVYRFGSVLALLSFSATGCIIVPQTQDGSEYLLAANGLFRGTSEGGESNIMSVLGAFYYVSTHNGSTDIVTNADGAPVARFVYEPFGRVNSDLTDLDPDRNGVHYGEQFQFTGQEFEPETGLFNYKARIYDPETGRFLQPDPKHSERAGFDNWDRYQYANNNPVNFTDPTGESWLSERFKGNPLQRMTFLRSGRIGGFGKAIQRSTFVNKHRVFRFEQDFIRGSKTVLAAAGYVGLFTGGGLALLGASFLIDPAFTLGMGFSVLNYAAGAIKWIFTGGKSDFPSVSFRGGGIIVKGPLLMEGDRGITLGPFVNVGPDASDGTIQHELAHVRQYKEWGGWKYMGHTWSSPLSAVGLSNASWAEDNADQRAGTNTYRNNPIYTYLYYDSVQNRKGASASLLLFSQFGIIPRLFPMR
jgi:RHS repeat-associated protein